MVICIFASLFVVFAVLTVVSIVCDFEDIAVVIFLAGAIFCLFAGAISFSAKLQENKQENCSHSFISCKHKQSNHTEFSLCKVSCVDCGKEIGIFTPKEIYEYNLSHR